VTQNLHIHGFHEHPETLGTLAVYGADAGKVLALADDNPALAQPLHPELPYIAAEVVWAAREEMARTLDDVLSRRTRALLLNAQATLEIARKVAQLLAGTLGRDQSWIDAQVASFGELAARYTLAKTAPSAAA
jgi:glycerol-3-phosphate dehydrogenase